MDIRHTNPLRLDKFHNLVEPIAGEFFPSWVARLTVANGIEPYRFLRKLSSKEMNGRDLLFVPNSRLVTISRLAGVPATSLREMTCWPESELANFFPFTEKKERGDWIIPVPYPPSDRPGLTQVCVECLREDAIPFLRKAWRMAYLTRCPFHRIPLIDRCPRCTAPLDPFVRSPQPVRALGSNLFLRCPHCGYHLLAEEPPTLHAESPTIQSGLQFTHKILRALKEGWFPLSGFGPVPTPLFLGGLRVLLRILVSRFGMEWRMWISHEANLGPCFVDDLPHTRLRYFERLPGLIRERLLAETAYLLDDWPHRFLDSIQAVGLHGSFILEQRAREVPYWLLTGVQDPLCRLRFPAARCCQFPDRSDVQISRARTLPGRSNTFEKIAFIQDHPEWSDDIPQLAIAMVDFGLFRPNHPVSKIHSTCRTQLALISRYAAHDLKDTKSLAITGYRAKLVAQRRFLKALKLSISKKLEL